MELQTVSITKIINGGYGFSRLENGQVALIRHALPGETVTVIINKKKKDCLYGEVQEVILPHNARRSTPCEYYRRCGGCDLQHCDYPHQLDIKKSILTELMGRWSDANVKTGRRLVLPPIASAAQFGYRQRIRLQVTNGGKVGFYRHQSHEIITIRSCLLAAPVINKSLTALIDHAQARNLLTICSELELQLNPLTGKTICIFQLSRKPRPTDETTARTLCRDITTIEKIFFSGQNFQMTDPLNPQTNRTGRPSLAINYPEIKNIRSPLYLSWEVGGFCQVNLSQNLRLIEQVLDWSGHTEEESILDLYCGMGNFSIPLAHDAARVLGIEGQGAAIRSAKRNGLVNGLENIIFKKSPVHRACQDLADGVEQFDTTVIDPPRRGIPGLAADIARLTRKKLIYISCDPATLCRDLADLSHHGFSIRKIQPIDMFPQTHHLETVVLLEKNR